MENTTYKLKSRLRENSRYSLTKFVCCCIALLGVADSANCADSGKPNAFPKAELPAEGPWRPRVAKLVLDFAEARNHFLGTATDRNKIKQLIPVFREAVENKPDKHVAKLYYYYRCLLAWEAAPDQIDRERANFWARKVLETPYNRVEAFNALGSTKDAPIFTATHRAISRDYPLYGMRMSGVSFELLNQRLQLAAIEAQYAAQNVPPANRNYELSHWSPPGWFPTYGLARLPQEALIEIGDLYAQMGDIKQADRAYVGADIARGVDSLLVINKSNSHPAWEKLATLYEKIGDWDMALHWRLKQLAGTTDENKDRVKPLTEKIIYLLARIGAGEPIEPPPPPKYDLEKLRRVSQIYLDAWFPNLAIETLKRMEEIAGDVLTEERARIGERQAQILFAAIAAPHSKYFWIVLWDQVWTYDKVVAVHKQAIEWGKKAGWEEARLKKLEEQITKLPELLKYVKEPKNFQDLLEGKATEPKW